MNYDHLERLANELDDAAERVFAFAFKKKGYWGLISLPRRSYDVDALLSEAASTLRTTQARLEKAEGALRLAEDAVKAAESIHVLHVELDDCLEDERRYLEREIKSQQKIVNRFRALATKTQGTGNG